MAAAAALAGGSAISGVASGLFGFFQGREANATNERNTDVTTKSNEKISKNTIASNEKMQQTALNFPINTLKGEGLPGSLAVLGNGNSGNSKLVPDIQQFNGGTNFTKSSAPWAMSSGLNMNNLYLARMGMGKTKTGTANPTQNPVTNNNGFDNPNYPNNPIGNKDYTGTSRNTSIGPIKHDSYFDNSGRTRGTGFKTNLSFGKW
jgi:hypothetical protein